MFKRKKKRTDFLNKVIQNPDSYPINSTEESLDFLVQLFKELRPSAHPGFTSAETNIERVTVLLSQNPPVKSKIQRALLVQFFDTNLTATFTESGIPLAGGLPQEFADRIKHKLLPPLQSANDFLYVIDRVFYKKDDYIWVEEIPQEKWITFVEELESSVATNDRRMLQHLNEALLILSVQIAQLGLEKDVLQFCSDKITTENNPFILQNHLVQSLYKETNSENIQAVLAQLYPVLLDGEKEIENIRERQQERGTSLRQTYALLILSAKLQRLLVVVDIMDNNKEFNTDRFVGLFKILVRNENRRNSIRELFSQGMGYVAYQIAEHKGSKGSKYITSSAKEYAKMLTSAMWGGFIIVFVALFKNLLGKLVLPPFWSGFLYSTNYSLGFIAIEQTGSTLATKQPAFTASAVAASLDQKKSGRPDLNNLAVTVSQIFRSQTASFFGNLIIVFPGTYLIAWAYHLLVGAKVAGGAAALNMLEEQHPWHSLSLLYACNTGVFLFLSGIIAGYVQNKLQFRRIDERLVQHPLLRLSLPEKTRQKVAKYIKKNAGAIIGSIALGFFLGMSGMIGKVFGIPFDIRHITISAGNTGIAVYGIGLQNIDWVYLTIVFFGVLGVGFCNFLVSFSLAFFVAVKSRGIHLREYPEFMGILWRYFKKKPLNFVRPPKSDKLQ